MQYFFVRIIPGILCIGCAEVSLVASSDVHTAPADNKNVLVFVWMRFVSIDKIMQRKTPRRHQSVSVG